MPSASNPIEREYRPWMVRALLLAKRGFGRTSPNPMVGAVLVKAGRVLGEGYHRQAGGPHAEVEAIRDAQARGRDLNGSTLCVTLEPCSTHGRTPPCTEAIVRAGIVRVVAAATDPNPKHSGQGFEILRRAGLEVFQGLCETQARQLNESFNHWIVEQTPWVTVKAGLTLDGKIATVSGESKWITGPAARSYSMRLRQGSDAILVGIRTVLADDPRLTIRRGTVETGKPLRRVVLDSRARTPQGAAVVQDSNPERTTIVATAEASPRRLAQLAKKVRVLIAPSDPEGRIDLKWLLKTLGSEDVTSLLVEGGGEVNASFLLGGLAHRIAFFYAPKILGGTSAPGPVGGVGATALSKALCLTDLRWRKLGLDFLLTARVAPLQPAPQKR